MNARPVGSRRLFVTASASVTVLALGGLTACGSSDDSSSGSDAKATASASAASTDSRTATVSVTAADGCSVDHDSFKAGAVTFKITNKDATAISEVELVSGQRIVGEKENLPPGFSGTFSVNVDSGDYSLYCPGAAKENTPIKVTGTSDSTAGSSQSALLAEGTKEYAAYVSTQVGYLVTTATALDTALKGTDLAAAQKAYMKARPYYEKIEPVAESFTVGKNNLDANIDARAGDVPAAKWTGFHPIEKGLFKDKSLKGLSKLGDGLVTNVKKLQSLTTGLTYKPFELANGAQGLLDEVASSKITGEEERYSHIDMLDFQNNDEGAEQAFADLQPALTKIDPTLTTKISTAFTALDKLVATYRTEDNASGFVLYSSLSSADKQKLAAAVKAVQEPLSQVASKVADS